MKAFTEYLKELSFYEDARRALMAQKTVLISGCADAQKAQMLCGQGEDYPYKLVLTFSDVKAKELYEDYSFFDKNTILFPAKDYIFFQADIRGQEMTKERICCYRRILEKEPLTIVTTVDALLAPCLPLQMLEENCITISAESIVEEEAVAMKLVKMGYEKTYQVEEPGQFSVRGGIIDIYDLTEENPYRIELWGDEVESIRRFDVLSQRSVEALRTVTIYPATEMILTKQQKLDGLKAIEAEAKQAAEALKKENKLEEAHRVKVQTEQLREQMEEFGVMANLDSYMKYFCPQLVSFLSLFPKDELLVTLDEPLHGKEHLNAVELEFRESMEHRLEKGYALPGQAALLYTADQVWAMLTGQRLLLLSVLDSNLPFLKVEERYYADARAVNSFQNSFEILLENLRRYHKNRYRVILLSPSRTRAKRLAEDICANELTAFYSEDTERVLQNGEIMVMHGQISKGFEYPSIRLAVITESDIFGKHAKKRKKKRYEGQKIHDFTELKVGDYVVHETHGLGIYRGIEKVCVDKVMKDYMKIEYRDGGTLYVLATGFDAVMKYASAESKAPKLNKLGTQEWTKTKSKVKGAVNEVAKDLVKLYAAREHGKGYQYGKDTVWQREFEEMFPYEETQDQLLAIDATKADMESGRIMDRLICGDVGYGKTEVAIRAAFKAVQEGKQVVFLVPTTILAKQHYDNFVQRMKDFPVTIEMMSRFRTAAQQKKTIEGLKKGLVDIVIGTHRVLSKDVAFKDLGLLIIDEEQRFGVAHKEKIKKLKENVDVLTLTATPIPRTLHMSLIGIRDMSVLEEPPVDRLPIQTYVMEYNDEMVREAIHRELARGGQVYYVYNRVNNIDEVANHVAALVPEANVVFAHGQMHEHELEKIMLDFVEGNIDVLVSTTIIETGVDIPNANTLIVDNADRMGLSQLHQLRGRVGRSSRRAYAYFTYRPGKALTDIAEKRLSAIREYAEFGAGFRIAMRDMEIRGSGNLLGAEQHGHMESVGYELYIKLLNQAVLEERGEAPKEEPECTVNLSVSAFLPESYVRYPAQRMALYKRIALIRRREDMEDMADELIDRYGDLPAPADSLLHIAYLRALAVSCGIRNVRQDGNAVFLVPEKLDLDVWTELSSLLSGKLRINMAQDVSVRLQIKPGENVTALLIRLLERCLELSGKKD